MENANSKRHIENEDEPPAKHQKFDSIKITDLNEFCLKNICSHLNLSSLLNVAMANKKLQLAATSTFRSKYGTTSIWLQNIINSNTPQMYTLDDDIYVCGLKLCLPFLRCFGGCVSELLVFDGTYPHVLISRYFKSKFSHHIDRYLNQYCVENVSSLLFYGRPAFSVENFRKPFRMVKKVRVVDTTLENGLTHFTEWFPNLCQLEMYTVCIDDQLKTMALPLLEHLTLKINSTDDACEWNFTEQNAMNVLHKNRQLRSLEIDMPDRQTITIQKILDIIHRNPSIERLRLYEGSSYEYVNTEELERLVCEHHLLIEIDLPRHKFTVENVLFCIRHLKLLKKFRFQMTERSEYDQLLQEFGDKWQLKQLHQTIQLSLKTH